MAYLKALSCYSSGVAKRNELIVLYSLAQPRTNSPEHKNQPQAHIHFLSPTDMYNYSGATLSSYQRYFA
jgi:hypothetical protein